ncbi:MAG: MerR family transcriptional regulator [Actinomycetota bacterium]|nr:MerR family transcriptional regulator [Actinomycetota bacterium]
MLGSTDRDYATIGEVVEELKREFPALSISKIRYLEEEGLINPKRTSGGYRKFSTKDVERIRTILRLQKEKFLPLSVIKSQLKVFLKTENYPRTHPKVEKAFDTEMSLKKAAKSLNISDPEIETLKDYKIIQPVETEEGNVLGSIDLSIMKLVKKLENYGMEPRHIRFLENTIERELSFYQQIFPSSMMQKGDKGRKRALGDFSNFITMTQDLKDLLLKKSIKSNYGADLLRNEEDGRGSVDL